MLVGIFAIALASRYLLRAPSDDRYHLQDRLFTAQLDSRSPLAGKTLAESRLGDVLELMVLGAGTGGNNLNRY